MSNFHTPTARDVLNAEAVDLATDVATLLLEFRDRIETGESVGLAMTCLEISDRILKARRATLPGESRVFLGEARTCALRTMVALERLGAHEKIPRHKEAPLYRRLSGLAAALGALAE